MLWYVQRGPGRKEARRQFNDTHHQGFLATATTAQWIEIHEPPIQCKLQPVNGGFLHDVLVCHYTQRKTKENMVIQKSLSKNETILCYPTREDERAKMGARNGRSKNYQQ